MFRFILWALAEERVSAVISCRFSFIIEVIWNSHLFSNPACSGTNSLFGAWPAVWTVWIADDFMVLSSILETAIQSSWKIEQ